MKLNASKSVVVSYTRKTHWLFWQYSLAGEKIPRKNTHRDLGVIFDKTLTFRMHVDRLVSDCNRFLGIIFKLSFEFKSLYPLRLLYVSLVLSRVTFSSPVWSGCSTYLLDRLEGVQRRFAFMVHKRFYSNELDCARYTYTYVLSRLNLLTVRSMLYLRDNILLFKLINGKLCAPLLLSRINFRTPGVSRSKDTFYNHAVLCPISRITSNYNRFSDTDLDIFHQTLKTFINLNYDLLSEK